MKTEDVFQVSYSWLADADLSGCERAGLVWRHRRSWVMWTVRSGRFGLCSVESVSDGWLYEVRKATSAQWNVLQWCTRTALYLYIWLYLSLLLPLKEALWRGVLQAGARKSSRADLLTTGRAVPELCAISFTLIIPHTAIRTAAGRLTAWTDTCLCVFYLLIPHTHWSKIRLTLHLMCLIQFCTYTTRPGLTSYCDKIHFWPFLHNRDNILYSTCR